LFTKVGGFGGSSTRTELAAGIIALCCKGPVHIGSDSRAFVDKANALIQQISTGIDPQLDRPWNLCHDGDLWDHFCRAVASKGTASIKITWVKGHAQQSHIDSGATTNEHKSGNDQADSIAGEATSLHGPELVQIAGWLHDRAKSYVSLMKHVSHHIVEGYLIHRALVAKGESDGKAAALDSDRGTLYRPLMYPSSNHAAKRRLANSASVLNYKSFVDDNPCATHVQQFLANLEIVPLDEDVRPITWIELFILHAVRGHFHGNDAVNHCDVRPSPDKLIRDFKNLCRNVVFRTIEDEADRQVFKPATRTRDILSGVAISGQNASPSFNVVLRDEEKLEVAKGLVNLSRHVTGKNVRSYLSGNRKFIPRILTLNGNSSWVSTISTLCPPSTVHSLWARAPLGEADPIKTTAFYKCRLCDKVEPSTLSRFQFDDLDIKIKCIHCSKMSAVKDWTCCCGKRWYACALHSKSVALCNVLPQDNVQANGQGVSSSRTKRKPVEPAHDYHELLTEDLRREKKRSSSSSLAVVSLPDIAAPSPALMSDLRERLGMQPSPRA